MLNAYIALRTQTLDLLPQSDVLGMQRCLRLVLGVDQVILALDLSILITKDDAVSMAGMANIRAAGELVSRPVATQPLHLQRIVRQAFLGQTQVAAQLLDLAVRAIIAQFHLVPCWGAYRPAGNRHLIC